MDSDRVTDINVDDFEAMYSDEDSNYWNGIMSDTVQRFNSVTTGIRNLTCVYKDGRWLNAE